jgi:hypothetical protein
MQIIIWNSTPLGINSISTFNANTWYFIAFTYNGSMLDIYVNGQLDKSLATTQGIGSPASFATGIGHSNGAGGFWWNGLISDVRLYNRALSAAEIQAIYNAEK